MFSAFVDCCSGEAKESRFFFNSHIFCLAFASVLLPWTLGVNEKEPPYYMFVVQVGSWLDLAEHLWLKHVIARRQNKRAESYTFISGFVRCHYSFHTVSLSFQTVVHKQNLFIDNGRESESLVLLL